MRLSRRLRIGPGGAVATALAVVAATLAPGVGRATTNAGDIVTVAGGPGRGAATNVAQMPVGIAVFGNLIFVSDREHKVVRRIDTATGDEQVFAGGGIGGGRGDGGPATSAQLYEPAGVAVDRSGNVYVADRTDRRIRKVDAAGMISTIAGGGTAPPGDGGLAKSAALQSPVGVAADGTGNLFIADSSDHLIRKVDSAGFITTVAGGGLVFAERVPATATALQNPSGVTLDDDGNLIIADSGNDVIRKVDKSGIITTIAGDSTWVPIFFTNRDSTVGTVAGDGGPATGAQLFFPTSVTAVAGNLLIADTNNHRIRRVDRYGMITTFAGGGLTGPGNGAYGGDGGPATSARLDRPYGVAVGASGEVLIADTFNNRLRAVGDGGTINTIAGTGFLGGGGDGQPAGDANLSQVTDVVSDSAGNTFVADVANHRVRKIDSGGVISTVAGNGMAGFDGTGSLSGDGDGGPARSARLNRPSALALGPSGDLYVAQRHRVRRVDSTGRITTVAGTGTPGSGDPSGPAIAVALNDPGGLAVDSGGNLFIADTGNHRVLKVDPSGATYSVAGTGTSGLSGDGVPGGASAAQLSEPVGLAVDPDGNLYIADRGAHRVRRVDRSGTISTFAGGGAKSINSGEPSDLAVDALIDFPSDVTIGDAGAVLIAAGTAESPGRIYKVDGFGLITAVAGGVSSDLGDGGPATAAWIGALGVSLDAAGNILIADGQHRRIRKVLAATVPSVPPARPPLVTKLEPTSGATFGGTMVKILGRNLADARSVRFGGVSGVIASNSDSELVATAPPSRQGAVEVVVKTSEGEVSAGRFTYGAGAWVERGSLQTARYGHTATLLDAPACHDDRLSVPHWCGKVLVAGGTFSFQPSPDTVLASAELYDPATDSWTEAGALKTGRFAHSATLLGDGKVLVVGGQGPATGSDSKLASAEVYDPDTGAWTSAGSLAEARFSHTATLLEGGPCRSDAPPPYCGRVLVAGGATHIGGRPTLASAELFDPSPAGPVGSGLPEVASMSPWSRTGDLATSRADHSATLLPDGRVLVAGGGSYGSVSPPFGYNPTKSAEVYDPAAGTWSRTGDLGVARMIHTATLIGGQCRELCGKVLAVGGLVAGAGGSGVSNQTPVYLHSSELYDPRTGRWEASDLLGVARGGHVVATLADGDLLVAGGGLSFDAHMPEYLATASAERYDVATGVWSYAGSINAARGAATATRLEGSGCRGVVRPAYCDRVLVAGGTTPGRGSAASALYAGDSPLPRDSSELYMPAPEVSRLEPAIGGIGGGTAVKIVGREFDSATAVSFGDATVACPSPTCTVRSATEIEVQSPGQPTGRVEVSVSGPGGTSARLSPAASSLFSYLALPGQVGDLRATALSPSEVRLEFTAPDIGDGSTPAQEFLIRQATVDITPETFTSPATSALCPGGVCTFDKPARAYVLTVSDLAPGTTYHYALRAVSPAGAEGLISNQAIVTMPGVPGPQCTPLGNPGSNQVAYPGGHYSLVGLPEGTAVPGPFPVYGWFDSGAGGTYTMRDAGRLSEPGRGYWVWFACPTLVDLGAGVTSQRVPLDAYHASMVGNPSARSAATVSGHDFAARWDPSMNGGSGGYTISDFREPQQLGVGQGIWTFSFVRTEIRIEAGG